VIAVQRQYNLQSHHIQSNGSKKAVVGGAPLCGAHIDEGVPGCSSSSLDLINTPQLTAPNNFKYFHYKYVISGDHLETYKYQGPKRDMQSRKLSRPKRNKQTDKDKNRHTRRSRTEVRRIVNTNCGRFHGIDKFLTLTYARAEEDLDTAHRDFDRFMKRFKRAYGNFQYLAVPALQWSRFEKYGVKVWHFHIALFGVPYLDKDKLAAMWGQGFVDIRRIQDYENPGQYIGRYLQQDFDSPDLEGRRKYYTSQGLQRPVKGETNNIETLLTEHHLTDHSLTFRSNYENEYVGKVQYSHYDLRKRRQSFDKGYTEVYYK